MKQDSGQASLRLRFVVVFALIALPVYRMLLQHEYGLFYPEVAVMTLGACVVSWLVAVGARTRGVFAIVILLMIMALSPGPVQQNFFPVLQYRWILAGLAGSVLILMRLMGRNFYIVLLVFAFSSFGVDVVKSLMSRLSGPTVASAPALSSFKHVLYLVLDEHIGLGGLPADIPGGPETGDVILTGLQRNNFTVYRNAFANYRGTWDSIPSILNGQLTDRSAVLMPRPNARHTRMFDWHLDRGYTVRIYQSDYLTFALPGDPAIAVYTYMANKLAAVHRLQLGWLGRLRQMLVIYLRSDRFLAGIYDRLIPARLQWQPLAVFPVATREFWPDRLLSDMRSARQNTLFFAHLMIPHYPYIYEEDGTTRPPEEWAWTSTLQHYDRAAYTKAYQYYFGQVRFLQHQLEKLFQELRKSGLYDSTMIILHGDHGSRIRLLKESERGKRAALQVGTPYCAGVSRYDYPATPDLRDLLNRFSTLLAIKPAGAKEPRIIDDKRSVLSIVWSVLGSPPGVVVDGVDVNSVYLFDQQGVPRPIRILDFWEGSVAGQ